MTDEALKQYIYDTLLGRGRVDWDEFAIEVESECRRVGDPLDARQYERCLDEMVGSGEAVRLHSKWRGMVREEKTKWDGFLTVRAVPKKAESAAGYLFR